MSFKIAEEVSHWFDYRGHQAAGENKATGHAEPPLEYSYNPRMQHFVPHHQRQARPAPAFVGLTLSRAEANNPRVRARARAPNVSARAGHPPQTPGPCAHASVAPRLVSRRLIGGVELMQAIGLRLEENGTVLALREVVEEEGGGVKAVGGGGKWDRVPQSTLRRLDTAAKVMQSP